MKAYSKFLDIVEKIEKALLCISVAVMLVVMIYQVILRYVFAHATAWSEELARYLFIFQVMLASAIGIRRNSHLQIDALIHLLKPRWRMLSTVISTLIGVVFLCFLLVYSIDLVKTGANNLSVGLGVPMSIPYLCLPIGTVLMILTSVEVIFKQVRDFRKGGKEDVGVVVIIFLLVLSFLGVPIFIALGIGTLVALHMADMALIVLPQKLFAGMNSSSLLAIPFFILAGSLMSRSITEKLINIANALIGQIKGSLGVVTVLSSTLFGAISGSGVATASAIGGITIPAMKKSGYPDEFATAISSISSILGPIIPPSIPLIVYASVSTVSVASLFIGSVLPGILLACAIA